MPEPTKTFSQSYNKTWSVTMQPVHWAVMGWYAKRKGQNRSETLRQIIQAIVDHDDTFDAKAFRQYVTDEVLREEPDGRARDVLEAQVDELVKRRTAKKR